MVPTLSRIGFLANQANPNSTSLLSSARTAAEAAGLSLVSATGHTLTEIETAFQSFVSERVGAIMVPADAALLVHRDRIAELALQSKLPSMFVQREYVEAGGLMSYGEDLREFLRRAAVFVDKIFKGARAGDLPIEQPVKFNLTINRKTADGLGLPIPPQILVFAEEVIE